MERDANYTAVGAFVLLVTVMAGLFIYWYSDTRDSRDYTRYEIYFQGSVSGLSVGGPVRYLGVDVGRIRRIRVDGRSQDRVQVVADIDTEAPISDQTLAKLSLQGVTGLLFIDLQKNENRLQAMAPVPMERYPVINSVRSDFDELLATLPDIAGRVRELISRVQDVFSPENTATVARLLKTVDKASQGLPRTIDEINQLLAELRDTTQQMNTVASTLNTTTQKVTPAVIDAVGQLGTTAEQIAQAAQRLNGVVEENRSGLRGFTQDSLPEFERTLREARGAVESISALARRLSDDPSRLIYQPAYRGVEIQP